MKIRPSTTKDHTQMSQILTEAFFEYPVFTAFLPEIQHRREFLQELFVANVRVFEKINGSYVAVAADESVVGVLLVKDNQHKEPGLFSYLTNSRLQMLQANNLCSLRAFFKTINEMDGDLIEADATLWYVDSLAISPSAQGQGVGTALLQELDHLVQQGKIVLSTNTENNAKFYVKNGYQQVNFSDKHPHFNTWQFTKILK